VVPQFLFAIIFVIYFLYSFCHGKLGMLGNVAGWKHDVRMHEVCGILT